MAKGIPVFTYELWDDRRSRVLASTHEAIVVVQWALSHADSLWVAAVEHKPGFEAEWRRLSDYRPVIALPTWEERLVEPDLHIDPTVTEGAEVMVASSEAYLATPEPVETPKPKRQRSKK